MAIVAYQARRNELSRSRRRRRCASCRGITWRAFPSLMMPVVLLGGIYTGVTTPTEAAAVAAAYALLISVVLYRSVSFADFYRSVLASARTTASIGMLIAGALVFNYVVTVENIPRVARAPLLHELGPVADRLPDPRQHPAAAARLRARRHDDPAGHRAGAHPDRAGARHRHGAFRRGGGRQHHARPGDAALRPAALHHDAGSPRCR